MLKTPTSRREEVIGKGIPLEIETIIYQFQHLQGKVLTLIEAIILDKDQLRAVKDIIKNDFSNQMMYVEQLCYPEVDMLTRDSAESLGVTK